jgi:hypothetical protein
VSGMRKDWLSSLTSSEKPVMLRRMMKGRGGLAHKASSRTGASGIVSSTKVLPSQCSDSERATKSPLPSSTHTYISPHTHCHISSFVSVTVMIVPAHLRSALQSFARDSTMFAQCKAVTRSRASGRSRHIVSLDAINCTRHIIHHMKQERGMKCP